MGPVTDRALPVTDQWDVGVALLVFLEAEFFELGLDRLREKSVAFGVGVQEVGHDGLGEGAVFIEKDFADVEVVDSFAFGEGGDVLLMSTLILRMVSLGCSPLGKTPRRRISAFGQRARTMETMREMPSAVSAGSCLRWPVLLVPIMMTATLASCWLRKLP